MLSLQSVQTFFSAITFALTLLLVFKTNSSYARWWEARKDVGQLVSLAHNIVRQVRFHSAGFEGWSWLLQCGSVCVYRCGTAGVTRTQHHAAGALHAAEGFQ
jgi:uncharacterized protein CbrC (UPF0167 family)